MSRQENPLLSIRYAAAEIENLLTECSEIFKVFNKQDSGCVSYGVRLPSEERLFVKHAETANAVAYLKQSETFHSEVKHPALPKLLHSFPTLNGYAHVYDWVEGEVLGSPDFPGKEGRDHQAAAKAAILCS
ncbi:hypothetical protein [Paenibacillus sp. OAS669]|uniref:hypothetical protein n=1 Tax=Paenibacillus sp. OAS669 TaxID=2663821 RepID=UPI00178AE04E|nr:hypothetical protein [Paenibacillus sp. OAS669]MBE1445728.1 hypothetical protein [Paenibacillus sp. OAS669]